MFDVKNLDRAIDRLVNKEKISEQGDLLEVAAILTRTEDLRPDDRRRLELKERFLAHGRESLTAPAVKTIPLARPGRRWLARRVAAAVAAITFSFSGVAYAASGSMPDSSLYPVKRALEAAALTVTAGNNHARLEKIFAQKRWQEGRYLLKANEKAADRSLAIKLLSEARAAGDPSLKNRVDDLLEQVGAAKRRRTDGGEESKENKIIEQPTGKPIEVTPKPKATEKGRPDTNSKAGANSGKPH